MFWSGIETKLVGLARIKSAETDVWIIAQILFYYGFFCGLSKKKAEFELEPITNFPFEWTFHTLYTFLLLRSRLNKYLSTGCVYYQISTGVKKAGRP